MLSIVTYNIHKGFDAWNKNVTVEKIRESLAATQADFVLLQEVRGALYDASRAQKEAAPQHDYLAQNQWPYVVYGANRFTKDGHHGNAVLSRYPILAWRNHDLTASSRWESRGALEAEVVVAQQRIHLFSVHLGLLPHWRRWQLARLREVIAAIPHDRPVIIGGDFNDWENKARDFLECLGFLAAPDRNTKLRTFPTNLWPIGCLDQVYVRGLNIVKADVLRRKTWRALSDHFPLHVAAMPAFL